MSEYVYSDGGRMGTKRFRTDAARDCACRAAAIALELPYGQVYDELIEFCEQHERITRGKRTKSHPNNGVYKDTFDAYLKTKGWEWVPTKFFGKGTTMHLHSSELPPGRIIARVSKHFCAVIDRTIYDTRDPSRDGNRLVYGYWRPKE